MQFILREGKRFDSYIQIKDQCFCGGLKEQLFLSLTSLPQNALGIHNFDILSISHMIFLVLLCKDKVREIQSKRHEIRTIARSYHRHTLYSSNKTNWNKNTSFGTGIQMLRQDFSIIFKMQRVDQTESAQEIEMRETQAISPDSIIKEEASTEPLSPQSGWKCYWKQCTFLAMLIVCSTMFGYEINTQKVVKPDGTIDNYDFMVFCPVNKDDFKTDAPPNQDLRRLLLISGQYTIQINDQDNSSYLNGSTFLVRTQSRVENNSLVLQYCGKMKFFEDDCNNASQAKDNCTASPMFDIPDRKSVDIIWVNNLDPNTQIRKEEEEGCFNRSSDDQHCSLMTKLNPNSTFVDPTIHPSSSLSGSMRISKNAWPMSTHLHGAEVRPVFDGNPLSWNSNDKANKIYGTGTILANQTCYYGSFHQNANLKTNPPRYRVFDPSNKQVFNFKVNRYPNQQNPGTLWYHDHSMRLTQFNVKYGLAGFYILRDSELTQYLGIARKNEKFVLITSTNTSYELDGLVANTVYRFRFLNGNYAGGQGTTLRYYFTYGTCDNNTNNMVPFTLIGADSSLFDYGIENRKVFVISNAERIDLLIKFAQDKRLFTICGDNDLSIDVAHKDQTHIDDSKKAPSRNIKIPLKQYSAGLDRNTKESRITNINLTKWVSYTDFKEIPVEKIAVKRMRPLMLLTPLFTIHGRKDFHSGQSQNPVIGTIEDWFIINTMGFAHPIHIHLINFQVVKVYDLKLQSTNKSSYYEMDFVAEALKIANASLDSNITQYRRDAFPDGNTNYTYLSSNLSTIKNSPAVRETLNTIFPEDKTDENRVSGLDLLAKYSNGTYKYITGNGSPSKKIEYSRWKDTGFVEGLKAFQFRIRWAKSSYDEIKDKATGNYFHAPADQLREFPGFVYHCHILKHEDNEMMRPIMLQLPEVTPSSSACNNQTWAEKSACINTRCSGK